MNSFRKFLAGGGLLIAAACLLLVPRFSASPLQPALTTNGTLQSDGEPMPAFHAKPPLDALPPTMEPSLFADIQTFNAYVVAGREKKVLYQQPCYCHCDRSQGHGSLLDCFIGRHAAGCDICQKEDFYAYEQAHKGKTPTQIREGIMQGEWAKVDTTKYAKNHVLAPAVPAK